VSSEDFDDFQTRYDEKFFGSDKKNKGQDGKKKDGSVPKEERPVQPTPPPAKPAPPKTDKGKPGQSSTSSAKDIRPQSLLWSVFAPIVVTWIGGLVV
jgi:hypothetical protein